jgi:hypothetical protein
MHLCTCVLCAICTSTVCVFESECVYIRVCPVAMLPPFLLGLFWGFPRSHRLSSHSRLNAFVIQTKTNLTKLLFLHDITYNCFFSLLFQSCALNSLFLFFCMSREAPNAAFKLSWQSTPNSLIYRVAQNPTYMVYSLFLCFCLSRVLLDASFVYLCVSP